MKLLKRIFALCFALTLLSVSAVKTFADEYSSASGSTTVNGKAKVNKGDIITYTLYLGDAPEPIVGFELRLFYDKDILSYKKGSIEFKNFPNVIVNDDIPGMIPMNTSQLNNLPDFSKKAQFVSASFDVIGEGDVEISYFFTDLYGEDMQFLKNYTFTYDITRGSEGLIVNENPPVNKDRDIIDKYKGSFSNYADGMGKNYESASSGSGEHAVMVNDNGKLKPYVIEEYREVDKDSSQDSAGSSKSSSSQFDGLFLSLIIGGIVLVGVILTVILIIISNSKNAIFF